MKTKFCMIFLPSSWYCNYVFTYVTINLFVLLSCKIFVLFFYFNQLRRIIPKYYVFLDITSVLFIKMINFNPIEIVKLKKLH